ncbi:MAG: hypothetical protein ACKVUS_17380 [Saprospiraceae bacterium]
MLRTILSYWLLLLLALCGCRKDSEKFQPYPPSAQELSNLFAQQVPDAATRSIFALHYLTADTVLKAPNGARFFLIDTDHLFADAATGAPVPCSTCPDLKVEITQVLDKSDIVAWGLHTVGDSGTLFESGGMVRVTATCNGQPLTLLPDRTLKIQLPNNDPQNGFFVFYKNQPEEWGMSSQEVFEAEWPASNGGTQSGYELLLKNMGWAACGQLLTDSTASLCIELPSGFADQNTLAYIVFKNQQVVAPLHFNLSQNKFCYQKTPTGFPLQLVAVSKLGEQYWLGKTQTELGSNAATLPLGTQQMTEEAVLNFVKNL